MHSFIRRRCGRSRPPRAAVSSRGLAARLLAVILACAPLPGDRADAADVAPGPAESLFRADNLVAWCIVPFDAKKRGPEERAAMMEKLGL
jgi:hypothetical protein